MNNVVTITNLKENILDFELSAEGIEAKDIVVKFVIEADGIEFAFPAKKAKGKSWTVTIPKMPTLERTTYNYCINAVTDGYYFEPLKGKVNVVGPQEVFATVPKQTAKPKDKPPATETKAQKPEKKKISEQTFAKTREKPIAQIARELMEQQSMRTDGTSKLSKPSSDEQHSDKSLDGKIREILESIGYKPKDTTSRTQRKFSLMD